MGLLVLRQNKGIYSIATTFFFVIVVIFVVLLFIYNGAFILSYKKTTSEELADYGSIKSVKDRLYFCYGRIFDKEKIDKEKIEKKCRISSELIRGYIISELEYGECTEQSWEYVDAPEEAFHVEVYVVPIQDGNFICPGKVEVFI